eukprot:14644073-Alexandrium_andersonii.AAC.1
MRHDVGGHAAVRHPVDGRLGAGHCLGNDGQVDGCPAVLSASGRAAGDHVVGTLSVHHLLLLLAGDERARGGKHDLIW